MRNQWLLVVMILQRDRIAINMNMCTQGYGVCAFSSSSSYEVGNWARTASFIECKIGTFDKSI
jgi:hypothetical protein